MKDPIISVGVDLVAILAGDNNLTGTAALNGQEKLQLQEEKPTIFLISLKNRKQCHACYRS